MGDSEGTILIEEGPEPRIFSLIKFLRAEHVETFGLDACDLDLWRATARGIKMTWQEK